MSVIEAPTQGLLAQWLDDLGISHYICDHCSALHLSASDEGSDVPEQRLFIEEWGLLLSVEFQIRPVALLPLVAEMGQMNINYPTLKIFVDVLDDAIPQLVAGATMLAGAGLSREQFGLFVSSNGEMLADLHGNLQQMDCLYTGDEESMSISRQLH